MTLKISFGEAGVTSVHFQVFIRPETCNSWTSYLIIEEISTISNTLGAPCMSVDTDQQSSVIIT